MLADRLHRRWRVQSLLQLCKELQLEQHEVLHLHNPLPAGSALRGKMHPFPFADVQDYSPAAASLIKLTFMHPSLDQTEQRLHVLRPLQLLPKSQTLCEVKRWQPAERKHRFPQGRSFLSNGKQEKREGELISKPKCFRSQTKKTTRENGFKCS